MDPLKRGDIVSVRGLEDSGPGELIGSNMDGDILHIKLIDPVDGRARVVEVPVDCVSSWRVES